MCKVFSVWPKNIQRIYLSWHWRVMQNLKKNWLVVWKMTWGIWQSLTTGIMMGSFNPKKEKYELKFHRGTICHDNEEWCKIWRGIGSSFRKWHKEFDKFWPAHSKVSKIFTLMGSLWAKYILFELKKYSGLIFHETKEGYKIWRGIDSLF